MKKTHQLLTTYRERIAQGSATLPQIEIVAREIIPTETKDVLGSLAMMLAVDGIESTVQISKLDGLLEVATEAVALDAGVDLDEYVDEIRCAFYQAYPGSDTVPSPYIRAVYVDYVIAEMQEETYKVPYSHGADGVKFNDANKTKVKRVYVEVVESTIEGVESTHGEMREFAITELLEGIESPIFNDEKREIEITIIKPGLSKNKRLYTPEAIRDSINVFEGVKMYVDHQLPRPKTGRSVNDWVATIKETWVDALTGAGKGRAKVVRREFYDFLKDAYEDIGTSIDATLRAQRGRMVNGELVDVVEGFLVGRSVDFVTSPAAGGSVDRFLESEETWDMDWADINVDELRARRPDLVTVISAGATAGKVVLEATEAETLTATAREVETLRREIAERDSRDRIVEFIATEAAEFDTAARDLISERFAGQIIELDALEGTIKPVIERFRAVLKPAPKAGARITGEGGTDPASKPATPINSQIDAMLGIATA